MDPQWDIPPKWGHVVIIHHCAEQSCAMQKGWHPRFFAIQYWQLPSLTHHTPSHCTIQNAPLISRKTYWEAVLSDLEPALGRNMANQETIWSFAHFFIFFFSLYQTAWVVCVFWKLIPCRVLHLQIFSPILRVVHGFLYCAKIFKFN